MLFSARNSSSVSEAMTRSHPPTLLTLVTRTLREECQIAPGSKLLLAVSGGGDSMALLHVLASLRAKLNLELTALAVDHGLREEAAQELNLAEAFAAQLGVHLKREKIQLHAGSNLQARAREARYRLLRQELEAVQADFLVTAHHAGDRAETLLERLLRGAGPRGLAVLGPRDGNRLRPMIRADKATVLSHLARHRVPFSNDPSNADPRFLRVRIRNELLPLLRELSPGIAGHLNALADQLIAGPLPAILDAGGQPLQLGRSQLDQIQRAKRLGRSGLSLRLRGDREVRLDAKSGQLESAKPFARHHQQKKRKKSDRA